MNPQLILFYVIAAISVTTALGVVLHRNPIRSALFLVVNFVCLAALYVLLNAQVIAFLQILVYAGAIMVLFLFVIMLLNLGGEMTPADPLVGQKWVGLLLGLALLTGLVYALDQYQNSPAAAVVGPGAQRAAEAEAQGISQIQLVGWDLFTRYVYPFELTSILLLVGVIGVILLTRSRPVPVSGDASSNQP
jgi:NADH-quinone oxidoreductase subunit J